MKIEDAYLQFVNQVNRNLTNNNINVDKPRFILLFNDIFNRYVEWILEKRNEDAIRYISPLLILDKGLVKLESRPRYQEFQLPDNYFDLANLTVFAGNDICKTVRLKTWEVKSEDIEEKYHDSYNEPSLEYTETFYHTSDKMVAVYRKGFEIKEALLSYYRYPIQVDIEGYTRADGSISQSIDPELDDKVVGRVLIAMSKEFSAINNDPNHYQTDSDRLFTAI